MPLRSWIARAGSLCGALLATLLVGDAPAAAQNPTLRMVAETRFGVLGGDPGMMFGRIVSVAVDAAGRAYILDAQNSNLRVFTPDGTLVQEIGRSGRGPGEFYHPMAVTIDGAGRVFVLNPGNRRVEVYHPTQGGRLEHQGAFRVKPRARDMCAIGDRLYVLAPEGGRLLHEYTADGRLVRSFGDPPVAGDELMVVSTAGGRIACDAEADLVIYLPTLLPEVRGFSASRGRLEWRAQIPDYDAIRFRQEGSAVSLTAGPSRKYDVGWSVFTVPGYAVVLVASPRQGSRDGDDMENIRAFSVALGSGAVRPLSTPLPRVMGIGGSVAYSVAIEPWPRVTVHRVSFTSSRQ